MCECDIPLGGSLFYLYLDVDNGTGLLKECLTDCVLTLNDVYIVMAGDLNSITASSSRRQTHSQCLKGFARDGASCRTQRERDRGRMKRGRMERERENGDIERGKQRERRQRENGERDSLKGSVCIGVSCRADREREGERVRIASTPALSSLSPMRVRGVYNKG